MRIRILGLVSVSLVLFFFNNCGGQKFEPSSATESASISAVDHGLIAPETTLAAFKNASQVADNLPLAVNTPYEFRILGDDLTPRSADWTSNCTISGSALLTRTISCSSVGNIQVQVMMTFADSPAVTRTFVRNVTANEVVTPPSNLVTFNIPAGTGTGRWNQSATPAVVFKGQTLRILNQDTMVHRLHTGGNPCPHQGANIATGQAYDCVVTQAHSATATDTYDHNVGNSANFYILAIDGAAVYAQRFNVGGQMRSCADCHGALATSAKKNVTFAAIKAAIAGNTGGMGAITLSDDQLRALEYQLSR